MKEILEKEGKRIVEYIRMRLREEDKMASGDLYNSIRYEVKEDSQGNWTLSILSLDYLQNIEDGRKPGTYPPFDKIKKWIQDQRINWRNPNGSFATLDQKTFVISRSIKEKGIKPTPITKGLPAYISEKVVDEVKKQTMLDLQIQLDDLIKNINKK